MSLIQEALRRQREEGGSVPSVPPAAPQASVPPAAKPLSAPGAPKPIKPPPLPGRSPAPANAPPPAPSVPPAPPAADGSPEAAEETVAENLPDISPKAHRRSLMSVIGIVAIVWIIGALGVWLVFFAYQQWTKPSDPEPAVQREQASGSTQAPGTSDTGAAVGAGESGTGAVASDTMAASPALPAPGSGEQAAAGVSAPPGVAAHVEGTPAPPAWPYLKVTGVIGKGFHGAATINGRIVAVGEKIDGVEVSSIGEYGAKLEFAGETRFIKVGSSVE